MKLKGEGERDDTPREARRERRENRKKRREAGHEEKGRDGFANDEKASVEERQRERGGW